MYSLEVTSSHCIAFCDVAIKHLTFFYLSDIISPYIYVVNV